MWESLITPNVLVIGLANSLAKRCGALPTPDVIGLIGLPSLWILGTPRIFGAFGASSRRCSKAFPFSDFFSKRLAFLLNDLLNLFVNPSGFSWYVSSFGDESDVEKGFIQGVLTCCKALADKEGNSMPRRYYQALLTLAKDKNIVITQADKGGGIVILDKSEYDRKMHDLLKNDGCLLAA